MTTIRKIEDKLSDTTAYLYIAGFIMMLSDVIKRGVKAILRHITDCLIVITFVGTFVIAQAFDSGIINSAATLIIMAILMIVFCVLIKIKILEAEK